MKIKAEKREKAAKRQNARLRREGFIPSCLYIPGESENSNLSILVADFEKILRNTSKGELSTTRFSLELGDKTQEVLVKDIQYDPVSYKPLHIDFIGVDESKKVKVNVPLRFKGAVDCAGVKLGGILRQVLRYVKIQCVPSKIPQYFELDVAELGMKQSRKIADIALPEGVRLLTNPGEVAVTVAKR